MIIVVEGAARAAHAELLTEMHRLRKRVFHDRLRWDVKVCGDQEIDEFDAANPLYLISREHDGGPVRGCTIARITPDRRATPRPAEASDQHAFGYEPAPNHRIEMPSSAGSVEQAGAGGVSYPSLRNARIRCCIAVS